MSPFGLLWMMLLWTFTCGQVFCVNVFLFLLGVYLGVGSLEHVRSAVGGAAAAPFHVPSGLEGSGVTSSPAAAVVCLLHDRTWGSDVRFSVPLGIFSCVLFVLLCF